MSSRADIVRLSMNIVGVSVAVAMNAAGSAVVPSTFCNEISRIGEACSSSACFDEAKAHRVRPPTDAAHAASPLVPANDERIVD